MSNDLLFELGTEELPSGAVELLSNALADNLIAAFNAANLSYGEVRRFATPRRLAVLICDVQMTQESQSVVRRGPSVASGAPTPALIGFAKSCGVTVEQLTTTKTDKGEWWIYESIKEGATTQALLPSMIANAIDALPIPKPMRWGSGEALFARPVHWAVLLLGNDVVDCELLGVKTGRASFGHRYHHPQSITITSPRNYEGLLKDAYVIADFSVRRQLIHDQVQQLTANQDKFAVMPSALVDEVTSIVEWPHALLVNFEAEFLDVPPEALIAAMQSHQKCFALRDGAGQLLPQFITIANIESSKPAQVVAGNEKVMRARLSDAAFFFRQDKNQPLKDYQAATVKVLFQQQLGSLADKTARMQAFLDYFAASLSLDPVVAKKAAELSKCDLMTGMVGEFPELQGLMGYYYALHDGESITVATALNEQYMPRFAADALPASSLGLAMSLADRMDTLVGTFAIGQKPTGVKDPFKLRRHALAVVRMLLTVSTPLNLSTLITQTRSIYGEGLCDVGNVLAELRPFILERMQSFYQSQGIGADIVHAVRARQDDWLFDVDKRVKALLTFIELPEAQSLAAACKRVNNLLQHAQSESENGTINDALLMEPAERVLFDQISAVELRIASRYNEGDYVYILSQLASLREPLDAFFECVMVMVDDADLRKNRLNLLAKLQSVLQGVADISLLQPTV